MIKASVVLAFYNKVDYLKLVFAGLEGQTFKDFEVIIADDGSSPFVVEEIELMARSASFPVIHLWQEDRGFRKNRMLNRAVDAAGSNYIIFIDADCVPHPVFIEEHLNYAEPNFCLTGRRVNLSENFTKKLTPERIKRGFLENEKFLLIIDGLFGGSFDVEKGFYFRSPALREYFNKKKRGLLGCNFSIHKEDLVKINGFDERYEAPSIGEDSDIQYRLELNGTGIKSLNNIAVQYHLYHKLQERPVENLELFNKVKESGVAFTPFGIKKEITK